MLAVAFKNDDGFLFEVGNNEISSNIRIGSIIEDECYYFDDKDCRLYKLYADKVAC